MLGDVEFIQPFKDLIIVGRVQVPNACRRLKLSLTCLVIKLTNVWKTIRATDCLACKVGKLLALLREDLRHSISDTKSWFIARVVVWWRVYVLLL